MIVHIMCHIICRIMYFAVASQRSQRDLARPGTVQRSLAQPSTAYRSLPCPSAALHSLGERVAQCASQPRMLQPRMLQHECAKPRKQPRMLQHAARCRVMPMIDTRLRSCTHVCVCVCVCVRACACRYACAGIHMRVPACQQTVCTHMRPISVLRFQISEGLTQAES